jgi:tetratricopeptide (TPR) repeat protein
MEKRTALFLFLMNKKAISISTAITIIFTLSALFVYALPTKEISKDSLNRQVKVKEEVAPLQQSQPPHKIYEEKLDNLQRHIDKLDDRFWQLLIGLFLSVITVIGAIFLFFGKQMKTIKKTVQEGASKLNKEAEKAGETFNDKVSSAMKNIESNLVKLRDTILQPAEIGSLLSTGLLLHHQRRYDESINLLSKVIEKEPNNPEARYYRGLSYKKKGKHCIKEAIDDFEIAVNYAPHPIKFFELGHSYLYAGRWKKAREILNKAIDFGFENKAETLTFIGEAYYGERLHEEAIAAFDKCLNLYPQYAKAIEAKGLALMQLNKYDAAIDLYDKAIEAIPSWSNFYLYKSKALWEGKYNLGEALNYIKQAERINKRDFKLCLYKGSFLFDCAIKRKAEGANSVEVNGLLDEAIQNLQKGLSLVHLSSKPVFRNKLCQIYIEKGLNNDAIEEGKRSIQDNPAYPQNYMALAATYLSLGHWYEASKTAEDGYNKAMHPAGKIWCMFFNLLGMMLQGMETTRFILKVEEFKKLINLAPYFDSSQWDWSRAKDKVISSREGLNLDSQKLLMELLKLMDKCSREIPIE